MSEFPLRGVVRACACGKVPDNRRIFGALVPREHVDIVSICESNNATSRTMETRPHKTINAGASCRPRFRPLYTAVPRFALECNCRVDLSPRI